MKIRKICILWIVVQAPVLAAPAQFSSRGYIPPVNVMLSEVFQGRKLSKGTEVILRHRVEIEPGQYFEMEERIVNEPGKLRFVWKGPTLPAPVGGTLDAKGYHLTSQTDLPVRSFVFLKYFLSQTADRLQSQLVAEKFVKPNQLGQFEPSYAPTGDPHQYQAQESFRKIGSLKRLQPDIGIAIVGEEDPTKMRAVYFDNSLRGLRRIEWGDGPQIAAWNFSHFVENKKVGTYPRSLSFDVGGSEKIVSEVVAVRSLDDRQLKEFHRGWQQMTKVGIPTEAYTALRLLLSYR